jgi:hypothetical protein
MAGARKARLGVMRTARWLLAAIAKARLWLDGLIAGTFASTAEIPGTIAAAKASARMGRRSDP